MNDKIGEKSQVYSIFKTKLSQKGQSIPLNRHIRFYFHQRFLQEDLQNLKPASHYL